MTPGKNVIAGLVDTGDKSFADVHNTIDKAFHRRLTVLLTEACYFCKTISGRQSQPRPPIFPMEQP
jgi:hypothetical protein